MSTTTKTEAERADVSPDIPKIVAMGIAYGAGAGLKVGFNYLRLKRKARKASAAFVRELERSGVPSDLARELGDEYGAEISVRSIADLVGGGFSKWLPHR
jgi:hypothetical protein